MKLKMISVVPTNDNSSTIFNSSLGTHYHSTRGAIGEAMHVFIRFLEDNDAVFEVGFGTGLNALLSLQSGLHITYTTIELFPLPLDIIRSLSFYCPQLEAIHTAPWGATTQITPTFSILKIKADITSYELVGHFTKIFFDPFDPTIVPNQWSEDVFRKLRDTTSPNAKLLTYCAKGIAKQALRNAGFTVTRLPGALGKHHMLLCY